MLNFHDSGDLNLLDMMDVVNLVDPMDVVNLMNLEILVIWVNSVDLVGLVNLVDVVYLIDLANPGILMIQVNLVTLLLVIVVCLLNTNICNQFFVFVFSCHFCICLIKSHLYLSHQTIVVFVFLSYFCIFLKLLLLLHPLVENPRYW